MPRPRWTSERANLLFVLYAKLGPDRSLQQLAGTLRSAGTPISLATLKRYSRDYGWQRALIEADSEAAAQRQLRAAEAIGAHAERHAQLGRAFQAMAARATEALLRDPGGLRRSSLSAIARAGATGAELERRALAEQHDRRGVAVEIWSRLTVELIPAFVEINGIADEEIRIERFVELVDRLIDAHLRMIEGGVGR